jgi:hypothetical protein
MQPLHCPRCQKVFFVRFKLDNHITFEELCVWRPRPEEFRNTFSPDKFDLLKSRKGHGGLTEAEKWRQVYMILFPDDPDQGIPSPCK